MPHDKTKVPFCSLCSEETSFEQCKWVDIAYFDPPDDSVCTMFTDITGNLFLICPGLLSGRRGFVFGIAGLTAVTDKKGLLSPSKQLRGRLLLEQCSGLAVNCFFGFLCVAFRARTARS